VEAEKAVEKRRVGRPMKAPTGKQKRSQVTVLLRADIKRALVEGAKKNGRTLSAEGEAWFERLLAYDETLAAMRTDLATMQKDNIGPALWRAGFTPEREMIDGKVWTKWAEPGYPGIPRTGFVS
jgi:hypothetical protein